MDLQAELRAIKDEHDFGVKEPIDVSQWNEKYGQVNKSLLMRVVLLEGNALLVEMSIRGYTILGNDDSYDEDAADEKEVFESMQALLMQKSPEYRKVFQERLWAKLSALE